MKPSGKKSSTEKSSKTPRNRQSPPITRDDLRPFMANISKRLKRLEALAAHVDLVNLTDTVEDLESRLTQLEQG